MGNHRIAGVRPSVRPCVRPPSYLREDWSDSRDIAQSDEDIPWDSARLFGFSKFQF